MWFVTTPALSKTLKVLILWFTTSWKAHVNYDRQVNLVWRTVTCNERVEAVIYVFSMCVFSV